MNLKKGDKVKYLDEVGIGTVVLVSNGFVTVEDTDGFTQDYLPAKLILNERPSYETSLDAASSKNQVEDSDLKLAPEESGLKIGDKVRYLDSVGVGTVVGFGNGSIRVEDPDGFVHDHLPSDLVLEQNLSYDSSLDAINSIDHTETRDFKSVSKPSARKRKKDFFEVDLHIHHLVRNEQDLSNREMVLIQMNHVKLMWDKTIEHRNHKLIFIHGVGTGTLKNEIAQFLKTQTNCTFGDASIANYGYGATEVNIWYN